MSPAEIARIEAENGLRQFDEAVRIIEEATKAGEQFVLRPSLILELNRLAVEGLEPMAGKFRTGQVYIDGTQHMPPPADHVAPLVSEMCDYVNSSDGSPIHQAAFLLWRLNWIHPFVEGNGRTSRIISYVVLSIRLGFLLPGQNTIPEQIAAEKSPYYSGLDAADAAWMNGRIDVSALESLLSDHLITQLSTVIVQANNPIA